MEPPPEQDNPFPRVVDRWERVIEDMHATAEEYRDAGWTAVAVHPDDVTVLDPADIDPDSGKGLKSARIRSRRFRGPLAQDSVVKTLDTSSVLGSVTRSSCGLFPMRWMKTTSWFRTL